MHFSLLTKFPIFAGLAEPQLQAVNSIICEKRYAQGELITREGEKGDVLFLLLSGVVEVSKSLTLLVDRVDVDTRDKSLLVLRADDAPYFGEMALLRQDSRRSANVKALQDCLIGIIHRKDFIALCDQDTILGYRLMRNIAGTLAERLEKTNKDVLKLTTALSLALQN